MRIESGALFLFLFVFPLILGFLMPFEGCEARADAGDKYRQVLAASIVFASANLLLYGMVASENVRDPASGIVLIIMVGPILPIMK